MSIGENGGYNRKEDSLNENGGGKLADAQRVRFGVLASRQDSHFFCRDGTTRGREKKGERQPALATGQVLIFPYGGMSRLDWASKEERLGQG